MMDSSPLSSLADDSLDIFHPCSFELTVLAHASDRPTGSEQQLWFLLGAMEELILNVCKQQSDYIVRQLDDRLNKMENSLRECLSRVAKNSKKIDKITAAIEDWNTL
ncbi:unnamed protein product [Callosobruchus maculatus]|uniref:Uncharacterized protein n=1 Tax=Callosobruchus maculatus TaxID=64391 RepID=A0A653CNU3_CALMS|nr:unnamed protein product [Callosobruchus maculatus]